MIPAILEISVTWSVGGMVHCILESANVYCHEAVSTAPRSVATGDPSTKPPASANVPRHCIRAVHVNWNVLGMVSFTTTFVCATPTLVAFFVKLSATTMEPSIPPTESANVRQRS